MVVVVVLAGYNCCKLQLVVLVCVVVAVGIHILMAVACKLKWQSNIAGSRNGNNKRTLIHILNF